MHTPAMVRAKWKTKPPFTQSITAECTRSSQRSTTSRDRNPLTAPRQSSRRVPSSNSQTASSRRLVLPHKTTLCFWQSGASGGGRRISEPSAQPHFIPSAIDGQQNGKSLKPCQAPFPSDQIEESI